MPRLVAFLRAINVGGHNVRMGRLRELLEALGFQDVETFIASGNVVFSSRTAKTRALELRIQDGLRAELGYEVATFIRTDAEVIAVARSQPFAATQHRGAATFCVGFLADRLSAGQRKALMALRTNIDDFQVDGREVYWLCKRKQSDSKFSNALFERTVGARVTFRAMSTVTALSVRLASNSAA